MDATATAMIFDLDGTLVDSVYQHVLAWHAALREAGVSLSVWRIHRKIGMSGGLPLQGLMRELGHELDHAAADRLSQNHTATFLAQLPSVEPLPGANDLLAALTKGGVPWAIATSGRERTARPTLDLLEIPAGVPIITRDQVHYAKPNPDLFLTAARALGFDPANTMVVGDARVYDDPLDLLRHIDELGIRDVRGPDLGS